MEMIVHQTARSAVQPFALPDLKDHLRVSQTDFADDPLITSMGHTAAEEIEHLAQIALLTRTIRVTVFNPGSDLGLRLPIGPAADDDVPTVTIDGEPFTGFDFVGGIRPYIRWLASYHSLTSSRIVIEYQAGFGETAADIPHDLAQALMDQAALHYDARSPLDRKTLTVSPHMMRITARYRGVAI